MVNFILWLIFLIFFCLFLCIGIYVACHFYNPKWHKSTREQKIQEFLFEQYAMIIAPFHFTPTKCKVIDKENCSIWNCKCIYKDGKYDKCQKGVLNEISN